MVRARGGTIPVPVLKSHRGADAALSLPELRLRRLTSSGIPHLGEHNPLRFRFADARSNARLDCALKILEIVKQHTVKYSNSWIDISGQSEIDQYQFAPLAFDGQPLHVFGGEDKAGRRSGD